jgi:nicotinamidase-related amidase
VTVLVEELLEGTQGRLRLPALQRPVLLVLDLQALFTDPASPAFLPEWSQAAPRCEALVEAFRERGLPVVWTRHVHPEGDAGGATGVLLARLQRSDDPWSAPGPELTRWCGIDPLVDKARFSAFSAEAVRAAVRGADAVVIAGVQTPRCVLATALEAARLELLPVVAADACAARDPAEHRAALTVLALGHAFVAGVDEIVSALA